MTPYTFPYLGGKSRPQIHDWIIEQLPAPSPRQIYVEPFFGVGGVFFKRPTVGLEVINDRDDEIANLWRCIRDHPADMADLMSFTPWAESEYRRCLETGEDDTDIERARKTAAVITMSVFHAPGCTAKEYVTKRTVSGCKTMRDWRPMVAFLHRRLEMTVIENRCALELLEQFSGDAEAVIYCDPPYPGSGAVNKFYGAGISGQQLAASLATAKAAVAVSGRGDDWDGLGWRSEARQLRSPRQFAELSKGGAAERLWMNYPATHRLL